MYSGSEFQMEESGSRKSSAADSRQFDRRPMRRLVAAERRFRRPGTSATRVSGPSYLFVILDQTVWA